VDKYTWVDVGSSYLPSDILAGFLYAQFEAAAHIQSKRQRIWQAYDEQLADWADKNGVHRPFVPQACEQPYHMYYLLMPSLDARQALIEHLKQHGVLAVFHYLPLHQSEMGRRFGGKPGDCPVTENISDRLVRLPFYNELTESDLSLITQVIREFHFAG
jgi:dTDP-4-amino-4,6-dideoxygalactose transaminase